METKALEDVRVVDFSWVVVGPVATKLLADHGATVVRIGSAKRPDLSRVSGPFKDKVAGLNRAGHAAYWGRRQV